MNDCVEFKEARVFLFAEFEGAYGQQNEITCSVANNIHAVCSNFGEYGVDTDITLFFSPI